MNNAEANLLNDTEVAVADIPKLKFFTDPHDNGNAYATFVFEVHDGADYSSNTGTMTINVTPVNDHPVTADSVVNATEDVPFTFAVSDFPYTDIEDDRVEEAAEPIVNIRLQVPSVGTLWVDGDLNGVIDGAEAAIVANDVVVTADIPKLRYVTALHGNGNAYANFTYEVFDGTDYSLSLIHI